MTDTFEPYIADSASPKYHTIRMSIQNSIKSGTLQAGDMIPTEKELIDTFNVSRITVRKALDLLENEGYIVRVQGKGTFVKDRNEQLEDESYQNINGCSELIRYQKMTPQRNLIKKEVIKADRELAEQFGIEEGEPALLFQRIYTADGVPAIFASSLINLKHLPNFEKYDTINYSMVEIIKDEYKITIQKGPKLIKAVEADEEMAEYLQVEKNYPLLQMKAARYALVNDKICMIEKLTMVYRTDKIYYISAK